MGNAGRSLQQGFLRSPLEFSRVSSSFGARFHPIKKEWRQHAGTECHAGGLGSQGACLAAVASKDDGSAVRPRSAFESTIPPPD